MRVLRYILVAFVWLCWVPWTMRTMWRFLFWLGDGAWIDHRALDLQAKLGRTPFFNQATNATQAGGNLTGIAQSNVTDHPYLNMTANASYPWNFLGFMSIIRGLTPSSFEDSIKALLHTNGSQPLMFKIGKGIVRVSLALGEQPLLVDEGLNSTTSIPTLIRQGTMLSDVKYLQNLSKWPALNRTIMDILEGQLITLFVMVLIILVFLIREWVVQQQPNLGAPRVPAAALAIEGRPAAAEMIDADVAQPAAAEDNEIEDAIDLPLRPEDPTADEEPEDREVHDLAASESVPTNREVSAVPELQSLRPPMPRHALDRASELQRVLEEERDKVAGDKWPGIQVFMDYWNRGECRPQKVLELIHDEGRDEELAWIVRAMDRLKDTDTPTEEIDIAQLSATVAQPEQETQEGNGSSDESWQVLEDGPSEAPAQGSTADQAERTASNVPTWLEAQDLRWPPRDITVDHHEVVQEGSRNSIETTIYRGDNSAATVAREDGADSQSAAAVLDDATGDDALATDLAQDDTSDAVGSEGPPEENAAPAEQPAEAVQQATFWDTLANLIWPNVELPAAQQAQVANQLEPILQPEVEHEAPMPPPQAPNARQQGARQAPAPAPAPVPAVDPGQNVAAGLLPPAQDPEVLRAAREAGIDPEDVQAIEDGEDLDGLVELIGLQGPWIALVQHGMVCGAIVTLVVFFGIWVPYIVGKVVLVLMSNPLSLLVKLPLRWISFIINVLIDTSIFMAGNAFFWVDMVVRILTSPVGWVLPLYARMQQNTIIPDTAFSLATGSIERLAKTFAVEESFADNDIPYFSVIAHESLKNLEGSIYDATVSSHAWLESTLSTPRTISGLATGLIYTISAFPRIAWTWLVWELSTVQTIARSLLSLANTNPFKVRLDFPERTNPYNLELIHWSTRDRIFSIILGYMAFYAIGAMYVKMKHAMRETNAVRDEALEILSQAGGVLKVILIISIEMIAFPLYCGLLLDIAMLPLFEDKSLLTRLTFAVENPLTSVFLHWFVGTCYMFHFALFVSMCRKAMRSGVLYFIRDPDDPTFHPVRDVLERNLIGQLRKIMFSALVYGALVIICLGAVVWGVAAFPVKVFPIKWSSLNPATELPIDLLVLNFLVPVAIKVLDPSHGLEAMYKWWFHRCARALRLSHFLFNDRHQDEEGKWVSDGSMLETAPSAAENLAESTTQDLNEPEQQFSTARAGNESLLPEQLPATGIEKRTGEDDAITLHDFTNKVKGRRFSYDGRWVRAPASDQVRIPRGHSTFLNVDTKNNRTDGRPEPAEGGLHARNNNLFKLVWLPPHFQLRIGLFIFLLWTFAAAIGLGATVVPLAFGRYVFSAYLPADAPFNDVHAFCFGAYVLGGPIFLAIKYYSAAVKAYETAKNWLVTSLASHDTSSMASKGFSSALRALRVLYFYSFFGIIMPTLLATVFEFYVFIPLSTRGGSEMGLGARFAKISFIQNWTVGVLYLRIIGRVIHNNQESRPSRALFALVAPANNGATWWDPDVKLATRAFFLPAVGLIGTALTAPMLLGYLANSLYFRSASLAVQTVVYRYSYPALAAVVVLAFMVRALVRAYRTWRSRIRDEVYLIGERLHNFGERRPVMTNRVGSSA